MPPPSIQDAFGAFQRGDWQEAERICRAALGVQPDFADALNLLGIITAQTGRGDEALVLLGRLATTHPDAPAVHFNLGSVAWLLGRPDQALASYDRALALQPNYPEALNARGVALAGLQRHEPALASYDRALALVPQYADAHYNRGATLRGLGRLDEALASFERATEFNPHHVDGFNNRGQVQAELGRHEAALASYDRALALDPNRGMVHLNRGAVLARLGRRDEALATYDRALALDPNNSAAHLDRAAVLLEAGRAADALAALDRALVLRPNSIDVELKRAIALAALDRREESLACIDRVLAEDRDHAHALAARAETLAALNRHDEGLASADAALKQSPDYPPAHMTRGMCLAALGRHEEALASYDRALALLPDYPEAHNNRGSVLMDLGRCEEALAACAQALRLRPDFVPALGNRGIALRDLGRHEEAVRALEEAVRHAPDNGDLRWNLSLELLLRGELARGFAEYEWRWKSTPMGRERREFPQPLWTGDEPLAGRTILLHAEQGLGDTLQFCRYAKVVAARGAKVLLEVQPPLAALLAHVDGATTVFPCGTPLPHFDLHCPLLSLPRALGTDLSSIPAEIPYLTSDPARIARWRQILGEHHAPRVGLVWAGNPANSNDRNRSIPLERLLPLLQRDAEFISLQKDLRPPDRSRLAQLPKLRNLGVQLGDFADTAAVIDLLDLVVTVDTSVAHLAGALGKRVWILHPFTPDWRWLLDRDDSPWYPTARLFRQSVRSEWDPVIARVGAALDALLGKSKAAITEATDAANAAAASLSLLGRIRRWLAGLG